MNARMPALKDAFESAGFTDVKTVLASGNVMFSAPPAAAATLQRRAEDAMQRRLGRSFLTIVRSLESLRRLLASDPYPALGRRRGEKRIVTFLRATPKPPPRLPIESHGTRILRVQSRAVLSAYVPGVSGPDFMRLLEKQFGKEVTTRTWETVEKVVRLG